MNTYNLKLDLNKGPTYNVGMAYSGITLRQGDKRGCTVVAELYDHGTRFTEAGYTAYFVMGLPDREHYYREAATYSAGTATIIIDESLAASVAGDTVAYFELTKGGATYSTQGIKVSVLKDARADKTPGETYDSRIEQAIQELEDAIAGIDVSIEADVAEWLDQHPEATTTVQDGSITYQKLHSSTKQRLNNKLHRAITAPVVTASDAYAAPPVALVVDGKSVQDGTPTPDAPVAIQSVESVALYAEGTNLERDRVHAIGSSHTSTGITYVMEADGTITATGTATKNSWAYSNAASTDLRYYTLLPAGTYTASCQQVDGTAMAGRLLALDGTTPSVLFDYRAEPYTFTLAEPTLVFVVPAVLNGSTVSGAKLWVMLNAGATALPFVAPVGSTTAIPLQGHALRSLPDGTHDELLVDADGNVTLVQRVWAEAFDGSSDESWQLSGQGIATTKYNGVLLHAASNNVAVSMLSSHFTARTSNEIYGGSNPVGVAIGASGVLRVGVFGESTTLANTVAWLAENPLTIFAPLATPVEIPLGTVTLPSMPAPDLTAWASCTPATDIELDYERDVNIAVERLEAAIAELATN